jgi:hypothetical protein
MPNQSNTVSTAIGSAAPSFSDACNQALTTTGLTRAAVNCTAEPAEFAANARAEVLPGPGGWSAAEAALRAVAAPSSEFQARADCACNDVVSITGTNFARIATISITAAKLMSQSNIGPSQDAYAELWAGPVPGDPGPQWRAGDFVSTFDLAPVINGNLQIQFPGSQIAKKKHFMLGTIAYAHLEVFTAGKMVTAYSYVGFPMIKLLDGSNNDITGSYQIHYASRGRTVSTPVPTAPVTRALAARTVKPTMKKSAAKKPASKKSTPKKKSAKKARRR